MALYLGENEIDKLYLGNSKILGDGVTTTFYKSGKVTIQNDFSIEIPIPSTFTPRCIVIHSLNFNERNDYDENDNEVIYYSGFFLTALNYNGIWFVLKLLDSSSTTYLSTNDWTSSFEVDEDDALIRWKLCGNNIHGIMENSQDLVEMIGSEIVYELFG